MKTFLILFSLFYFCNTAFAASINNKNEDMEIRPSDLMLTENTNYVYPYYNNVILTPNGYYYVPIVYVIQPKSLTPSSTPEVDETEKKDVETLDEIPNNDNDASGDDPSEPYVKRGSKDISESSSSEESHSESAEENEETEESGDHDSSESEHDESESNESHSESTDENEESNSSENDKHDENQSSENHPESTDETEESDPSENEESELEEGYSLISRFKWAHVGKQ